MLEAATVIGREKPIVIVYHTLHHFLFYLRFFYFLSLLSLFFFSRLLLVQLHKLFIAPNQTE